MEKGILSFFAVGLIAVMLFTTSYKSWLRISYELNKVEITELFCINKEETAFNCEGKCHLSKCLEKADIPGKENHNEERSPQIQLQLFAENDLDLQFNIPRQKKNLEDHYNNLYSFLPITIISHPPRLIRKS